MEVLESHRGKGLGQRILDQIVAGVRSACTYAGAASIPEFRERAVVGVQSAAGYDEGRPQGTSW
jgi:IMP dehydrogenase